VWYKTLRLNFHDFVHTHKYIHMSTAKLSLQVSLYQKVLDLLLLRRCEILSTGKSKTLIIKGIRK